MLEMSITPVKTAVSPGWQPCGFGRAGLWPLPFAGWNHRVLRLGAARRLRMKWFS